MTDTPLAFDLDRLIGLISQKRPTPRARDVLSAHDILSVTDMIGEDHNPIRAAAILSRALGQPHLFVYEHLLHAAVFDLLGPLVPARDTGHPGLSIDEDHDSVHGDYTQILWVDGPSPEEARDVLRPLFQCGVQDIDTLSLRTPRIAIDPAGDVVSLEGVGTPGGYDRTLHHQICYDRNAEMIELVRDLSPEALDAGIAALEDAQRRGELPDDLVFRPTNSGICFERRDRAQILRAMTDIVRKQAGLDAVDRRR